MEPPQVPTIDLADGALTGPAQETAAAGVAIAVVLVVVDDSELVLVVVDDWEPHPAPASASAVAPTATENFNSNPPSRRIGTEQITALGPMIFYSTPSAIRSAPVTMSCRCRTAIGPWGAQPV